MKIDDATLEYLGEHVQKGKDDLVYFSEHLLGIKFHEGQSKAFKKTKKYNPINVYLCGNRAGKTLYISCKHIWKAYYKNVGPGKNVDHSFWEFMEYTTINMAPLSELTTIMFNNILRICRGEYPLKSPNGDVKMNNSRIKYFVDDDSLHNPTKAPKNGPFEISYANGSNFKAYTLGGSHADKIQGRACSYYSYDEFGRSKEPKSEFDDITPRLGEWMAELDIITTPDENNPEASDYLTHLVEMAEDPESRIRVIQWGTEANTSMTKDSISVMLVGKTKDQARQIMSGNIIKASHRYFPYSKVNLMFDDKRSEYKLIDFVNHFPRDDRSYFGGLDTSGMGKDAWSFIVIDYTSRPFKLVYRYSSKTASPSENKHMTRQVINDFYDITGRSKFRWQIDFTSEGGTIIYDDMRDLDPIPFRFGIEKGTGKNKKIELLDTLRRCITEESLISPLIPSLHSQLTMYRGPKSDKGNATDDVMSLALAVYEPFQKLLKPAESWIIDF